MRIITGKKWYLKTQYYMQESLNKNRATWIVPKEFKIIYERQLLQNSKHHALLFCRVCTFEEFFEEQLKKQQLFQYRKISKIESMLVVYDLLVKQGEHPNIDMINEFIDLFQEFDDYHFSFCSKDIKLPYFSIQKIQGFYDIYIQFKQYLQENHLYLGMDDQLVSTIHNESIYIDQFENFNQKQISLIQKMSDVTILMTTNQQVDSYTNVPKNCIQKLGGSIIEFDQPTIEVNEFLCHSFLNTKTTNDLKNVAHRFNNVTNVMVEVELMVSDIYQRIVNEHASYEDFVVYCLNSTYHHYLTHFFKEYGIPFYFNHPQNMYHTKIGVFLKGLRQYILGMKEEGLDFIQKSNCIFFSSQSLEEVILELLDALNKKICCKEYNVILLEFLQRYGIESKEIIAIFTNQLIEFDVAVEMPVSFYLEMLLSCINLNLDNPKKAIQQIPIYSSYVYTPAKYAYVIGCNEEYFPTIENNVGLILNEERIELSKSMPLGLHLYEKNELEQLQIFKLLMIHDNICFSCSSRELSGDTLFAASLFLSLAHILGVEVKKCTTLDIPLCALESSRKFLIHQNIDEKNNQLIMMRNQYITTKNQANKIEPALLKELIHIDYISPSSLEMYNSCPFKYFVNKGLSIQKPKEKVDISDFGLIVHECLDILSGLYHGNQTIEDYIKMYEIKDIDSEYQKYIANQICKYDFLSTEEKAIFLIIHKIVMQKLDISKLDSKTQYFLNHIQLNIYNLVQILTYQASRSDFVLVSTEQSVSKYFKDQKVMGRFDRQDNFHQYTRVIDYKSSSKTLDLFLATLGFNIQMLLYLDMVTTTNNLQKAGVLYFNTKKRVFNEKGYDLLQSFSTDMLLEGYKMNGYLLNDDIVIEAIGKEPKQVVEHLKYVKKEQCYKGDLLTAKQFDGLIQMVCQRVENIIQNIYQEGNINIMPCVSKNRNISKIVHACTYCDYKTVCLKDVFYNEEIEIENEDKTELLKRLGGENDD